MLPEKEKVSVLERELYLKAYFSLITVFSFRIPKIYAKSN